VEFCKLSIVANGPWHHLTKPWNVWRGFVDLLSELNHSWSTAH